MRKLSLLIGFLISSNLNAQAAEDSLIELFSTIDERLSHMESVALYKQHNQLPVEDIAREEIVLAQAKQAAELAGLDSASIEEFFSAQINVAKAIQYRYRAELLSLPGLPVAVDLDRTIRPAITELGNRIVELLASHLRGMGTIEATDIQQFNQAIRTRFVTESDRELLFTGLRRARLK